MRLLSLCVCLAVATSACEVVPADGSTTIAAVVEKSSTVALSTAIQATEDTNPDGGPIVLREFEQSFERDRRTRLDAGATYSVETEGVSVLVTPPIEGWELLGYRKSGSEASALFGWRGPTGFRPETLDVYLWDVGDDGVESAWSRLETDPISRIWGSEWDWSEGGVADVGASKVEWRGVRSPVWVDGMGSPFLPDGVWMDQTSARFYVVPVGDLTVSVMGYETRCACVPKGTPDAFGYAAQRSDDEENELSMWIDELEAFLAGIEFSES